VATGHPTVHNFALKDHNTSSSRSYNSTGVLDDLTTSSQSIPQPDVLLNHIEDLSMPVSQPSYDPFFPHRTHTPPLAVTITTVHDEGEIDEKSVSISSPHPSTVLHETEIDSQLQLIPSGNEVVTNGFASLNKTNSRSQRSEVTSVSYGTRRKAVSVMVSRQRDTKTNALCCP
jgi:hypothetical protein